MWVRPSSRHHTTWWISQSLNCRGTDSFDARHAMALTNAVETGWQGSGSSRHETCRLGFEARVRCPPDLKEPP